MPRACYTAYEKFAITHGVHIVGWPIPPVRSLDKINTVADMRLLYEKVDADECRWEVAMMSVDDMRAVTKSEYLLRSLPKFKGES